MPLQTLTIASSSFSITGKVLYSSEELIDMIIASLLINIIVLIPVCLALILDVKKIQKSAGIFTPARGILLAIYLTILMASIILLFYKDIKFTFALLLMQIVYKLLSPITVKTLKNPIVITNLLIAGFHLATIFSMLDLFK
jgi:hypothetical protein